MSPSSTPSRAAREIRLGRSGTRARIAPDGFSPHGWVLELGGLEQSHVDLADPRTIRHEYLRRMAAVTDVIGTPHRPLSALHLGAGALTLPRYLQAARPGSRQVVVEIERELPGFVQDLLPLPEGTDLEVVIGDAREELAAMPAARFDLVVVDVFTGEESPAHLACAAFHAEVIGHLAPGGTLLVNVGDEAGLRFLARQARELEQAAAAAGIGGVWTLADRTVLDLHREGNVVLAVGDGLSGPDAEARRAALLAAGPHPAAVLDPDATAALVRRIGA